MNKTTSETKPVRKQPLRRASKPKPLKLPAPDPNVMFIVKGL